MVWTTWRQHRAQALTTAALIALLAVFLLYNAWRAAEAAAGVPADQLADVLAPYYREGYFPLGWLPLVPLLVGVFWGAPVVAGEYERGTHRLAWAQSVSRGRWLAVKLGLLGGAVTAAGTVVGVLVQAWLSAFEGTRFADPFGESALFGAVGVAGGAWWLFAFALGVACGALTRRLLPALALTTAVFLLVLFGVFQGRELYAERERHVGEAAGLRGAYLSRDGWQAPTGELLEEDPAACRDVPAREHSGCLRAAGFQPVVRYHPPERFWRFQWTEAGLLALASALLLAPTAHRVARRPV